MIIEHFLRYSDKDDATITVDYLCDEDGAVDMDNLEPSGLLGFIYCQNSGEFVFEGVVTRVIEDA